MKEYEVLALENQRRASEVIEELDLLEFWRGNGCRANLIGSLAMGLLVKHLDIDIHVYSSGVTEESSFGIVSKLAKNPRVREIRCINGLHTEERCIAWHLTYADTDDRLWQIDIIHIEAGTQYDGYFELMTDRIKTVMTEEQRDAILRLKYETPDGEEIHGVEYYQAVIEDGVRDLDGLRSWVASHRQQEGSYWMPRG
ncbi:MAG: phosphoglycerate mutase family protein [Muribaculaceae bacterium]|nr:phosphoglycerate mutase family protein [Muribaculaceae bacterium]